MLEPCEQRDRRCRDDLDELQPLVEPLAAAALAAVPLDLLLQTVEDRVACCARIQRRRGLTRIPTLDCGMRGNRVGGHRNPLVLQPQDCSARRPYARPRPNFQSAGPARRRGVRADAPPALTDHTPAPTRPNRKEHRHEHQTLFATDPNRLDRARRPLRRLSPSRTAWTRPRPAATRRTQPTRR